MKEKTIVPKTAAVKKRSDYSRTLRKDNRQLFSMCMPGIILLCLFAYLPMFGLILAFKNYKFSLGFFGSEWVGLKNFEFFFERDFCSVVSSEEVLRTSLLFVFDSLTVIKRIPF